MPVQVARERATGGHMRLHPCDPGDGFAWAPLSGQHVRHGVPTPQIIRTERHGLAPHRLGARHLPGLAKREGVAAEHEGMKGRVVRPRR